jgi:hypothetical protein
LLNWFITNKFMVQKRIYSDKARQPTSQTINLGIHIYKL